MSFKTSIDFRHPYFSAIDLGYRWQKELRQEIQTLKERKGKLDTEQPFAHPFYWAAFALTGRGN